MPTTPPTKPPPTKPTSSKPPSSKPTKPNENELHASRTYGGATCSVPAWYGIAALAGPLNKIAVLELIGPPTTDISN